MPCRLESLISRILLISVAGLAIAFSPAALHAQAPSTQFFKLGANKKLVAVADERGNAIPDFSKCGYQAGGVALPTVPVQRTVTPSAGDDGARIQEAIDAVSQLPPQPTGFRGAVLLKRGTYRIAGSLKIAASGVVLRGEGDTEKGSILLATGKARRALIEIAGPKAAKVDESTGIKIVDEYVPVGATSFRVASTAGLSPGVSVLVRRFGNAAWIHDLGMDQIAPRNDGGAIEQWKPFALDSDRIVTNIKGDVVTIDAPLTCAIESQWGGGLLLPSPYADRITNVGVEQLRGVSEFDPSVTAVFDSRPYASDEEHCMTLVDVARAANVWVRNVTAQHFVESCVNLGDGVKWATVQDSTCFDMVSQLTGERRYAFYISGGQLCLVQRCRTKQGRHDFVVGSHVAGPNVFLRCEAQDAYASSEPHHRWSTGGLYDNVRASIAVQDRYNYGTGHGWAGANYVLWNCDGDVICQMPPTAQNWCIGQVGSRGKSIKDHPDGYFDSYGTHVNPPSLYLRQLQDRLGPMAAKKIGN
jgi:hypothetical protein